MSLLQFCRHCSSAIYHRWPRLSWKTHTVLKGVHVIRLLTLCSAGCVGQLRNVWLGLHESSCAQCCYLTPCDLKLVLGNWAPELGGSAEHNCAQQQWCQSANLSGGLADGRWSETFATLDHTRWRQRQSWMCAVLLLLFPCCLCGALGDSVQPYSSMGRAAEESGWGEGWTTEAPSRSLLALFSDSHRIGTITLSSVWGSGPEP